MWVSQIAWSSCLSHMIAATMYQKSSVPLGPSTWCCATDGRQQRSSIISEVSRQHPTHILTIESMKGLQERWHLHNSNCRNTIIYMHTTSHTLPTCHMSLCSLTVGMPKTRDFVGSIDPYHASAHNTGFGAKSKLMFWLKGKQVYSGYMSEVKVKLSKKLVYFMQQKGQYLSSIKRFFFYFISFNKFEKVWNCWLAQKGKM